MKIEYTPEIELDRLEVIESQFYPAAIAFAQAKQRDDRDSQMNRDFVAARARAAERVDQILDQYLDLSAMVDVATPLQPQP